MQYCWTRYVSRKGMTWLPAGKLLNMQSHRPVFMAGNLLHSLHLQFYSEPAQRVTIRGWIIPAQPLSTTNSFRNEGGIPKSLFCREQLPGSKREREKMQGWNHPQTHSAHSKLPAAGFTRSLKQFSVTLCHRSVGTNKQETGQRESTHILLVKS